MIKIHANLVSAVKHSMLIQLFNEKHMFNAGTYYQKHTMLKNNNLISSSITRSLQDIELESFKVMCITETPF